jgi:hypothetical protein
MNVIYIDGDNDCTIEIMQAFKKPDDKLKIRVTNKNNEPVLIKDGNFDEYELRCFNLKGLISILKKCDKATRESV